MENSTAIKMELIEASWHDYYGDKLFESVNVSVFDWGDYSVIDPHIRPLNIWNENNANYWADNKLFPLYFEAKLDGHIQISYIKDGIVQHYHYSR